MRAQAAPPPAPRRAPGQRALAISSTATAHPRELDAARRAAEAAAQIIRSYAGQRPQSWEKGEDQPVTRADLEAHDAIAAELARSFPDDAVVSEEAERPSAAGIERIWLVDPLDGTKEFIAGIPEYAVSVALTLRGEPIVSALAVPATGELFWAVRGGGAWLGEQRLAVSVCSDLASCAALVSRSELGRGQFALQAQRFGELRPLGSAALKMAWVAAGRGDVWVSLAPKNEWDVCGGDLLVREAGGVFVELERGPRRYAAADPLLRAPLAAGPRALVEQLAKNCAT